MSVYTNLIIRTKKSEDDKILSRHEQIKIFWESQIPHLNKAASSGERMYEIRFGSNDSNNFTAQEFISVVKSLEPQLKLEYYSYSYETEPDKEDNFWQYKSITKTNVSVFVSW